jgi:hypothetical protein
VVHCAHDPLGWNGKLQHRESWHLGAGGTIRQTGQRERQLPCRAEAAHDRAFGRSEAGVVGVETPADELDVGGASAILGDSEIPEPWSEESGQVTGRLSPAQGRGMGTLTPYLWYPIC